MDRNNAMGRETAVAGAPHIPPPNQIALGGAHQGASARGRASAPLEVVRLGPWEGGPPSRENANKGQSKYPFGELPLGEACEVRGRSVATVRSALKRWIAMDKSRKALRFQLWRVREGGQTVVRFKRIK